ncbi:hypothetical protein BDW75DRAFT_244444 [Aspergillus navahoensis]
MLTATRIDDWSLGTFTSYFSSGIWLRRHANTPQLFAIASSIFAAGVVYVPSLALAKASLIILYYRIIIRLVTLFLFLKTDVKTYRTDWTDLWMYASFTSSLPTFIYKMVNTTNKRNQQRRSKLHHHLCLSSVHVPLPAPVRPKLIGEGSSAGRYFKGYNIGGASTTVRPWRRRLEHAVLQDEIEVAENGSVPDNGSAVWIMKEVHWNVTDERREGSPALDEIYLPGKARACLAGDVRSPWVSYCLASSRGHWTTQSLTIS